MFSKNSQQYQTVKMAAIVNDQSFAPFMSIACKKGQGSDHSMAIYAFIFFGVCVLLRGLNYYDYLKH